MGFWTENATWLWNDTMIASIGDEMRNLGLDGTNQTNLGLAMGFGSGFDPVFLSYRRFDGFRVVGVVEVRKLILFDVGEILFPEVQGVCYLG